MPQGYENNHEAQLNTARMEELEIQIQQDENPIKLEPDESGLPETERKKKKLKRQLRKEVLTRMEESARTVADFEKGTKAWDKLDANRERKERYHEIKRSGDDILLDYGRAKYGAAFPEWLNDPNYFAIQNGRNLDVIFNCAYELHQFTDHLILLKILKDLKMENKDVLFFTIIREMSTKEFGELLDQTDRNIRKKRMRLLKRIQEELHEGLKNRKNLSIQENRFIERYENSALEEDGDAEEEEEKRCVG